MSLTKALALRALLSASTAAGMLCATPVLADDPDTVTDPADPAYQTTLSTVDVTGRRHREEPRSPRFVADLVDMPRAVTVIPQRVIEQTGATSLQDLLRASPGITFGAGEGSQPLADRPFIRGQASGNNVFLDGIRDTGGQQREVFALEQVEVIKGPDSVYSGRGSGGGSINLTSKAPRLEAFTHASLGVGTQAYLRGTVDWNAPLGETAALRINLMGNQGDVAGRDAVDYDKWGALISLAAGLGTDTRATASYYHLTSNQMPDYSIPLFTKIGIRTTGSGVLDVPRSSFYGLTARDFLTNTVDAFTFDISHRFSDAAILKTVSRFSGTLNDYIVTNPGDGGYVGRAADGTYWMKRGTKSRWNPVTTRANVTDLSGVFTTGGIRHSYGLALELTREVNRNASYSTYTTGGAACPAGLTLVSGAYPTAAGALGAGDCTRVYAPTPDDAWIGVVNRGPTSRSTTGTIGVSAFDSISLTDRLILNLGVRRDQYAVDGTTVNATHAAGVWTINPQIPAAGSTLAPGIVEVPRRTWAFVNYQAGLVLKPTRNTSVYASYATASTPPTISAGDQNTANGTGTGNLANVVLDPEETTNVEIGAKATFFRQQLILSAAAFRLERENAAILVEPNVFAQVGEARVQGIELGASGNVTDKWQVFGGYTWMDSELVRGAYNGVNQGDPLANTPEHSFSLFTTYRLIPALSVGGGVYYVSKSFGGNQGGAGGGANRIHAPEYTRVDLFASYEINARTSVQLNVQNAGDEAYIIRTNGVHHADVAPGRSATLALNLRF